jgi:uncharacterized damage-inducible protein DinB
MSNLANAVTEVAVADLRQLLGRIVSCLGKLNDDQIWSRGGEHENAIGNLVLHLCGNARQWIGTGLGGKPDIRVRDREFQARGGLTASELTERITGVVNEAIEVILRLDEAALTKRMTIQNCDVTGVGALIHVVQHFAQHTGQIILLTKHATGEDLGFYRHLGAASHGKKTP